MAIMNAPEGTVRTGDEFHDPANWTRCEACGVELPTDYETCFDCGEPQ